MGYSAENVRFILGLKLKNLRQERSLSLKAVAKQAGLSISYLSEIEKGKKYPKPDKLLVLAQVFGVPFDELVSLKVRDELNPLTDALRSTFIREFPFDLFGIQAEELFSLVTDDPLRAGALFRTFTEIFQMYDVRVDHFLFAALRSFQQLNGNYFAELEEAATNFRTAQGWPIHRTMGEDTLRDLLIDRYGYVIDESTLPQTPDLASFRSVYQSGPARCLYVNGNLMSNQKAFLYGREIGFNHLNLTDRPQTSSWVRAETFAQVLNNFKASYFAGALFIDRDALREDIKAFFQRPNWNGDTLVNYMDRCNVTPEMFFYRLTELVPEFFSLREIYFIRFSNQVGTDRYQVTKVFNMSRLPLSHQVGVEADYCDRWPAKRLLRALAEKQKEGTWETSLIQAQRTYFTDEDLEFFDISVARPLTLSQNTNSCVSLGILMDKRLKRTIRFWDDPTVQRMEVPLQHIPDHYIRRTNAVEALLGNA